MSSANSKESKSNGTPEAPHASDDSEVIFTAGFYAATAFMVVMALNLLFFNSRACVSILCFAGMFVVVLGTKLTSKRTKFAAVPIFMCAAFALFSPIDVYLREFDRFSCRVVPIYYVRAPTREKLVADLERQGKKRGYDYLIETSNFDTVSRPTWALLITTP